MRILDFNLQTTGFINPGLKILCDWLEYAQRGGQCTNCGHWIKPKTRVRVVMTDYIRGHKCGYRYCELCVWAMAKGDGGAEMDRRYRLVPVLHARVG